MFHSSELRYLRADVRVNCETFIALCKEAGLNVKVTDTVRDDVSISNVVRPALNLDISKIQYTLV